MPIYDNNGTTSYEIGTIYDNNGTTNNQIGKVYDNNGTTNTLIYSLETSVSMLQADWTVVTGSPTFNGSSITFPSSGWHAVRTTEMVDVSTIKKIVFNCSASDFYVPYWNFYLAKSTSDISYWNGEISNRATSLSLADSLGTTFDIALDLTNATQDSYYIVIYFYRHSSGYDLTVNSITMYEEISRSDILTSSTKTNWTFSPTSFGNYSTTYGYYYGNGSVSATYSGDMSAYSHFVGRVDIATGENTVQVSFDFLNSSGTRIFFAQIGTNGSWGSDIADICCPIPDGTASIKVTLNAYAITSLWSAALFA